VNSGESIVNSLLRDRLTCHCPPFTEVAKGVEQRSGGRRG
jgi:hypothetical protein